MKQSPALRQFTDQSLDKNPLTGILLDLAACEYLDSTFLGCIVGLHRRCGPPHASQTPPLAVCADGPTRRRLLGPTRLDLVLHCRDVAPPAQGEWIELPAAELPREDFGYHVMECHRRLAEVGGPQGAVFQAVADQLARELAELRPSSQ